MKRLPIGFEISLKNRSEVQTMIKVGKKSNLEAKKMEITP